MAWHCKINFVTTLCRMYNSVLYGRRAHPSLSLLVYTVRALCLSHLIRTAVHGSCLSVSVFCVRTVDDTHRNNDEGSAA